MEYNFKSTDPNNYHIATSSYSYSGSSQFVLVRLKQMITKCEFEILGIDDYITFVNTLGITYKITIGDSYSNLDHRMTIQLLNGLFLGTDVYISYTNNRLFTFTGISQIIDMSYNMKLILGYQDTVFPSYNMIAPSVGTFTLTPILFLLSQYGTLTMAQDSPTQDSIGLNTMATIPNTFSNGVPIIAYGDSAVKMGPGGLNCVKVILVDANRVPVKLLCPMHIILSVTDARDPIEKINS